MQERYYEEEQYTEEDALVEDLCDEAFDAGFVAFTEKTTNPHEKGNMLWDAWESGYREAEDFWKETSTPLQHLTEMLSSMGWTPVITLFKAGHKGRNVHRFLNYRDSVYLEVLDPPNGKTYHSEGHYEAELIPLLQNGVKVHVLAFDQGTMPTAPEAEKAVYMSDEQWKQEGRVVIDGDRHFN